MLWVEHLSYKLGSAPLLTDITFNVAATEVLGIIGANGAGKTTLLRTLLGELPAVGSLMFDSKPFASIPAPVRAKHIAVLPQISALSFAYTVDEVVALGRIPHASGLKVDQQIVAEAMSALDISYLTGRLYTELSGGEKQRTQLARVMAQVWRAQDAGARLLILDEPTGALDLGHKQQLMETLVSFAAQGVAIVLVEHDLNIIARYTHKLLALKCGHLAAFGLTHKCLTPALVKALFNAEVELVNVRGALGVL